MPLPDDKIHRDAFDAASSVAGEWLAAQGMADRFAGVTPLEWREFIGSIVEAHERSLEAAFNKTHGKG